MLTKGPLLLLIFFAAGPPGLAQEAPSIPEGSTVRLTSPLYTGVATLVGMSPDSLELGLEGLAEPIHVPVPSVTRLELRRPATGRERATRGAIWGVGTLGVVGFLITDRGEDMSEVEAALYSAIAGLVWGGVIGLLIPQDRWERIDSRPRSPPVP